MKQQPQLRVGPKSHPGKVRTENQDRMSRFVSPLGEVFIVADGMGGHQGGATAALMTIEGFAAHLPNMPPGSTVEDALQQAAAKTNDQIFREANSGNPATTKMGSTVVLALVSGSQTRIAHAGDSRAYLFRNGQLQRLTKDHSAVQRMIDHNMLTEDEARDHPDASVILRAFGQKPEIELEVSAPIALQPGDGLLLCTDGLCGYVEDAEIARALQSHEEPRQIADALVELALEAGGEDNVTVQFLQFGARPKRARGVPLESQSRPAPTARTAGATARPGRPSTYVTIGLLAVIAFFMGLFGPPLYRWGKGLIAPSPSPAATTDPSPAPPDPPANPTPPAPKASDSLPAQPSGGSPGDVINPNPTPATPPTGEERSGAAGAGTGSHGGNQQRNQPGQPEANDPKTNQLPPPDSIQDQIRREAEKKGAAARQKIERVITPGPAQKTEEQAPADQKPKAPENKPSPTPTLKKN